MQNYLQDKYSEQTDLKVTLANTRGIWKLQKAISWSHGLC